MQTAIIGRKKELRILEEALESDEAEMVAVLGRRRVGKTFLVSKSYENRLIFELSGTQNALLKKQLKNFRDELTAVFNSPVPLAVPEDWLSAFQLLKKYLKTQDLTEKKVIFFDEVPWLAGHKSGFLEALGYFWNSWASRQNLIVVICGSAASWMIRRVVHDKGGLHNRITKRINLQPFTLLETEAFLQSKGVVYDRFQLTQLYMSLGGIPQYLKEVKAGQSAVQNIDRLCFAPEGQLTDEFSKLYSALFSQADRHLEIVPDFVAKMERHDAPRNYRKIRFDSGGVITGLLEELEQSGFITSYFPFGKKLRDKIYRLTDAYSLFYLHFIEKNNPEEGTWLKLSTSQKVKSWSGYAFENVCLSHVPQLKKALGISGVLSSASTFYKNKTTDLGGAQIDLVLDRNDRTVNLFEMKFYDSIFVPTQDFADDLREKRFVFKTYTATNKHLSWVMVSAFGVKHNQYSLGLVDNVLTLDALFEAT